MELEFDTHTHVLYLVDRDTLHRDLAGGTLTETGNTVTFNVVLVWQQEASAFFNEMRRTLESGRHFRIGACGDKSKGFPATYKLIKVNEADNQLVFSNLLA